jgi:hypothetical protein
MRRKSFQPVLDVMEPRVALSSGGTSFLTDFFDNLFGKTTNDTKTAPHYTHAQILQIKAKHAAAKEARLEHLAELKAAHQHHG